MRRGVRKITSKDNRVVVRTETALHTEVMDNGYIAASQRPGSCCEEDPHDGSQVHSRNESDSQKEVGNAGTDFSKKRT